LLLLFKIKKIMKQLELVQMEDLQGGYVCFFAIPVLLLSIPNGTNASPLPLLGATNRLRDCWD